MPFEARPLPTAIWVNEEVVAGPFCKHCGYPLSLHSGDLLCPATPNPLLGPCCDCHVVKSVEVVRMVPDGGGRRRRREVRMERRIVRV